MINQDYKKSYDNKIKRQKKCKPQDLDFRNNVLLKDLSIISDSSKYDNFIDEIKKYSKKLSEECKFSISQIRNIFSVVKRIYLESKREPELAIKKVKQLRVKFAYSAGRFPKFKYFFDSLDKLVINIENKKDLENFYFFIEALVSFLKYFEKKN